MRLPIDQKPRRRLDKALQLGEPIFDADHPFVRSRRSSGVDRGDRLRACEESRTPPVNGYESTSYYAENRTP